MRPIVIKLAIFRPRTESLLWHKNSGAIHTIALRPQITQLLADYDDHARPLSSRSMVKVVSVAYFLILSSVATFSIKSVLVVYS
jgi:hypothetical protein